MDEDSGLSKVFEVVSRQFPPRLTMGAYADFVAETLRHGNPAHFVRQKALEEQIVKPFHIPPPGQRYPCK